MRLRPAFLDTKCSSDDASCRNGPEPTTPDVITGSGPLRRATTPSPTPPITRILHHVPVIALLADVVLFVVAVTFRGVDGNARRAAGALVALVAVGNGLDG